MTATPHTTADLMMEAAKALARRDPERLEALQRIHDDWMQTPSEADAYRAALQAMTEAADLLIDEPSGLEFADDAE